MDNILPGSLLGKVNPPGKGRSFLKKHRCCFSLRVSLPNMFKVANVNEYTEFICSFIHLTDSQMNKVMAPNPQEFIRRPKCKFSDSKVAGMELT